MVCQSPQGTSPSSAADEGERVVSMRQNILFTVIALRKAMGWS